jgi:ATP synthase protein I
MSKPDPDTSGDRGRFADSVGRQAKRRLKVQKDGERSAWFGLGMMGLIGWSIVVPTLLGALLGQWLDSLSLDGRSWTLALLVAGLVLGCWNAWHWVSNQDKSMREDDRYDDE